MVIDPDFNGFEAIFCLKDFQLRRLMLHLLRFTHNHCHQSMGAPRF
jgi:hypothetical protein